MKVLFFISSFPKLSETFILNQITGLIDQGVDVEILAWEKARNTENHARVESYQLLEKTTFLQIPKNKSFRMFKAIFIFIKLFFQNRKLAFETLKYKKYGQMASSLRLLYSASYFLKRKQVDAVIVHYGPNGNIANFYKKEGLLKERTMVFFHGQDITSFVKKWGNQIYRDLLQSDILLLPVSHYFEEKLLEIGANPSHVSLHRMGVDTKEFSYISQAPFQHEDGLRFLTIGRLVEKKGIETAIYTMSLLRERTNRPIHLDILGNGELYDHFQSLIQVLGLEKMVTLHGFKTQLEVNQAIEKADILLQLSQTAENGDMEGIPMVLMEAMSRGKLVISTYHSGIPELIDSYKNGFLVPEKNPVQVVEIVDTVIKNNLDLKQISLSARDKIQTDFDLDKWNKCLLKRCKGMDVLEK
ncbi:glycosyltransferase [Listeria sp. PSOL-1]|uniref:glycosyltransferase n=1 Tax=Listeria sp. PSOL-1 TaxID=1844999 RepID=UPI0013D6EDFF|nr:glycosyltransferase [Listeria sp. PSOL-1]